MNPVVIAVVVMLVLALCRVHVVLALFVGAVVGGLMAGIGLEATMVAFQSGLGDGAKIALSYALLGAFAMAVAHSGLPQLLALALVNRLRGQDAEGRAASWMRWGLIGGIVAMAMLLVGLLVTMGIGSSFSTLPIIAAIYVPLCTTLGFSPLATVALIGTAGALGDAGSPRLGLHPRPHRGSRLRRPARPHPRHRHPHLPALQPAAAGRGLGRRHGAVTRPICGP